MSEDYTTGPVDIVMSPVQFAAVMQDKTITEHETFTGRLMTRGIGVIEVIGGALEFFGAGGLYAAPEPTMITKAGGTLLALNGTDNFYNGVREVWTGHSSDTLTSELARQAVLKLGFVDKWYPLEC
ncbi:hypothetical protein LOC54_02205 [Acetobacter sp. AN02]|uniref:hypothetical protein n=1 Tax=Acetobacter sp. AN02 TaxID=2894186 RepID=UPI002434147F|nr:hypothetical protein [Acetobacter sp. AN02]MDG6093935.1 hypothetical protein [Acetobacter sp. AN02]